MMKLGILLIASGACLGAVNDLALHHEDAPLPQVGHFGGAVSSLDTGDVPGSGGLFPSGGSGGTGGTGGTAGSGGVIAN